MACNDQLVGEIRSLILDEVGYGSYNTPFAFALLHALADRAWITVDNLKNLKSDEEAKALIEEFHLYKKQLAEIEEAPITPEEMSKWV